jgi:hypothetical protein
MHVVLYFVLFFCQLQILSAQDWRVIGQAGRDDGATSPAVLAAQLMSRTGNQRETVSNIFFWMATRIEYYISAPRPWQSRNELHGYQVAEDTGAPLPITERVAIKVLHDRRTHCEGFARLFQSLCMHAGIEAVIVTGYGRTGRSGRFRSNHAWNAVWLDNRWQLLDVTWAANFTSSGAEARAAELYFLADPASFALHHFPDDLRWTLFDSVSMPPELSRAPFRLRSYVKYFISDYRPGSGTLQARLGDTLRFAIRSSDINYTHNIIPDSLWEEGSRYIAPGILYADPVSERGDWIYYEVPVNSLQLQWLHLMINQDAVLRYRVNVKKV